MGAAPGVQQGTGKWVRTPEHRERVRRQMLDVWTKRGKRNRKALGDPQCGLGYLDRGTYRTFEESVKRARDPARYRREP